MKRNINWILVPAVAAVVTLGCESHRHHVVVRDRVSGQVVVTDAPPPVPQVEVIGAAPSPRHIWVPGYWSWTGRRYTWMAGHWEQRPRESANYTAGHWERTPRGWVWYEGYWR